MIKKIIKKATRIVAMLVVVVIILALGIIIAEPLIYNDFYSRDSQKEFKTPGANDGLVQQGFCYAGNDVMLASGYIVGKKPSRVYVVKGKSYDDRTEHFVQLKDVAGKYTTSHMSGISAFKDKVYVCDSEMNPAVVLVYSLEEILCADNGDDVVAKQSISVHSNASFCHVENGILYVGEFFMDGKYSTADSHKTTTPGGDKNNAMVFGYLLDSEGNVSSNLPVGAISITDEIQGMTFAGDKIVLSSSYGLAASQLYVYDLATATSGQKGSVVVEGTNVPVIYLDSNSLEKTISAPPMSEEIVYLDGRLYVMNESASNKYIFGKLLRAKYIWSIEF